MVRVLGVSPAGHLHLAVVLDAYSRRIVGWVMAAHLKSPLALDALNMALDQRRFRSHAEARIAVFTFIDGGCNPRRRHSGLVYLSPIDCERRPGSTE